jgi:sugar transferase (PEP-CTERM/EpsH1 system associated)
MTQPLLSSTLRVAHVTLGLEVGGQERLLVEMARHRDHQRFEWTVISLRDRGTLAPTLETLGVNVVALDTPVGFHPRLWRRLAKIFREKQFDIVHTHDDSPLIYGMPAAWCAGAPVRIHTMHHGRLDEISRRQRWLMRLASKFSTNFVCVSHDSAQWIIEHGVDPARVQTLRNGVDLTRFAFNGPAEDGSIITVSRLYPVKDVANLLRAVPSVLTVHPQARFEIAGNGPCREELMTLTKELAITNHVAFLGEVQDIAALLTRARLFVLPSQSEGISLTLLEAMARGLPIVATRVGGNPEVVDDRVTGLLVPARNPGALAGAIGELLADAALGERMGSAGRQRVEDNFDIRKMMSRYEAMYS